MSETNDSFGPALPQNVPPRSLRDYTPARVALERTGSSIGTREVLDFQLAQAQARDAVHQEFDVPCFKQRLALELPLLEKFKIPVAMLKSSAADRATYIRRPGTGRLLDPDSAASLTGCGFDVVFVIADGLSAAAPERNAIPLLHALLPRLLEGGWKCGPLCVAANARVAIGDQVGSLVGAALSVILIGERPGLSAHDSLGAYITWQPQPGRTDASRNCISNIREGGLSHAEAAARIFWYLHEARSRRITGTALKEQALASKLIP